MNRRRFLGMGLGAGAVAFLPSVSWAARKSRSADVLTLAILPSPPVTVRTVTLSSLASYQSQLDAAPNGSRIVFPAGSVISGPLRLFNRFDLDLDMNGCVQRTVGYLDSHWALYHSERIRLRNVNLEGASPAPGKVLRGISDSAHGVQVFECRDIDVTGGTMAKLYGDPLSVGGEAYWSQRIRMSGVHALSAGRSGCSVLAGEDVTVSDNLIDMVGLHAFNVEPWQTTGGARRLTVTGNRVGSYGNAGDTDPANEGQWGVFFSTESASGPYTVEDVTVDGNTVTGRSLQTVAAMWAKSRVRFTNNVGKSDPAYYGNPAVLVFDKVDGLTVYGNGSASIVTGSSTGVVTAPPGATDTEKLATAKDKARAILAITGSAKYAKACVYANEIVAL